MFKATRRQALKGAAMAACSLVLSACAPAEPTPVPVRAATTAPKAEAPEPVDKSIHLRFMTRQGPSGDHMREFSKRYADETGGKVVVECEDTNWGDIQKKIETQFITGIMVDLAVMSTRNFPYLAKRGCFAVLEDMVSAEGMDLGEWFLIDWFRRWTDGKLSGLGGAAGLSNLLAFYNREWVTEAWGKEPTDDWTMDDFVECMSACVDLKGKDHYGSAIAIGGSVEADSWISNWGKSFMNDECTTCQFADEQVQDGIKWIMEQLANGNFPGREDAAEGAKQMFFAGKLAVFISNPGASTGMIQGCEESDIDLGVVLYPRGVTAQEAPPRYGFCPYANSFAVSSQSEHPEEAFACMRRVLSVESFKWLNAKVGKQPGSMIATWYEPEIVEKYPWFPKCMDVMKEAPSYYPVPANTRYNEYKDVGDNEIQPLVYGDVAYKSANINMIHDHLQEILDLPLPGA